MLPTNFVILQLPAFSTTPGVVIDIVPNRQFAVGAIGQDGIVRLVTLGLADNRAAHNEVARLQQAEREVPRRR
jgi:hypothetical protein